MSESEKAEFKLVCVAVLLLNGAYSIPEAIQRGKLLGEQLMRDEELKAAFER